MFEARLSLCVSDVAKDAMLAAVMPRYLRVYPDSLPSPLKTTVGRKSKKTRTRTPKNIRKIMNHA